MFRLKSIFKVSVLFVSALTCVYFLSAQTATAGPKILMKRTSLASPKGMRVYEIRVVPAKKSLVQSIARQHNLAAKPVLHQDKQGRFELYQEKTKDKTTRLMVNRTRGHITLLPNLKQIATAPVKLLGKQAAVGAAGNYVKKLKLAPKDASQVVPKQVTTLSTGTLNKQGGKTVGADKLQSVLFQRTLDGKAVMGKGSQLTVNLGDKGKVVGFHRSWNKVVTSKIKPEFLSSKEVYDRIQNRLKNEIAGNIEVRVGTPRLVYFGNDRKFVQPAFFFEADLSTGKLKAFYSGVVEALKNAPEPVSMRPNLKENPQAAKKPQGAIKTEPVKRLAKLESSGMADPYVGRYVVRNDSSHWVGDANDFKNGMVSGHCSGCPGISFSQYYWSQPYMWTTHKNYYANKMDIALMEGHGNHWLFTTRGNCCDVVNLNSSSMTGYGGNAGGRMDYLILKGCSVVPSARDRSDWSRPWWRIFKGLHQAIGFRTTMYINDNISDNFGYWIARNCRVLDSWFCATNTNSSYKWNRFRGAHVTGYGSVIMIPGREGEGIYHSYNIANATSTGLRNWYQH